MSGVQLNLEDYAAARRGRDQALDLLERTRRDYIALARVIASRLYAQTGLPVTVNDIRRELPPPEGIDGRVMGAIFKKGWTRTGPEKSARRMSHGREVQGFVPSHQ